MPDFGRAPTRTDSACRVNARNRRAVANVGDALPGGKSGMACRADTPGMVAGRSRNTRTGMEKCLWFRDCLNVAAGREGWNVLSEIRQFEPFAEIFRTASFRAKAFIPWPGPAMKSRTVWGSRTESVRSHQAMDFWMNQSGSGT